MIFNKIIVILLIVVNLIAFEDLNDQESIQVSNGTSNNNPIPSVDLEQVHKAYFKNDKDAILVYKYSPEKIYKIRTRILAKTTIMLPKGDLPIGHSNGSPGAFKLEFLKDKNSKFDLNNIFTITPKYIGTDTTLTILGRSGRIYNFYLYSIGLDSKTIPNSTVFITLDGKIPAETEKVNLDEKDKKIIALQEEINNYKEKLFIETQKDTKSLTEFNIAGIEFDYVFEQDFKLEAVFNDDEFTYFKFKNDFDIPKFYYIDEKQDKIYLNFTIYENIIKVHKLAKNWQLILDGNYLDISKKGKFENIYSEKKLYVNMTKTNFNLESISGEEKLKPSIIFNDNEFTYFKFDLQNNFKKLPVIYRVIDGYDNPVDFEIVNDFVVVKLLHEKFTLRLGEKHNCVRLIK